MKPKTHTPGMTLVEICVLVIVLAIAASIFLQPILCCGFGKERARRTTCTSNLRLLAMATTMYIQDNGNRFPGVYHRNKDGSVSSKYTGWAPEVLNYVKGDEATVSKNDLFYCPEMRTVDISEPVCYGYSALLLKPDGTGIRENQVLQPTQVGVMCDADPGIPFTQGGGIVSGYGLALQDINAKAYTVIPAPRHNKGTIIGYADGHAAICPDQFNVSDPSNGTTRCFYMAGALGLVDNPVAGLPDFTVRHGNATPITIGGDPCTRLLLHAACGAWKRKVDGFTYAVTDFAGSQQSTRPMLLGTGSGVPQGPHAFPIARDAMVVIVNNASTIKQGAIDLSQSMPVTSPNRPPCRVLALADLQAIFNSDGSNLHAWQVYLPRPADGTRRYLDAGQTPGGYRFTIPDGYQSHGSADTYRGTYCTDDWDIVDKVAGDPLGIAIVSAAAVERKRVDVVALTTPSGTHTFPSDDGKGLYPATPTWPFTRTFYVECTAPAWRAEGNAIANTMFAPGGAGQEALLAGPMFKASYWKP